MIDISRLKVLIFLLKEHCLCLCPGHDALPVRLVCVLDKRRRPMLNNSMISDEELESVNGGVGNELMNMKLSKLQNLFEKACRRNQMDEIMRLLGELQARGQYGWAKETAEKYGIKYI